MWNENYRSNFDYPRLAWDLGFSFACHNSQATLDRGKLNLIDIDKIIVDRDIATVERNIPLVVQFKLDPEQIKILDPNFVKVFRLSQLSVEYLIFCKKYLDNTVVLIRNDIAKVTNENHELHLQIEELTKQLSELRNQIKLLETTVPDNVTAYKCEQCSKVFASEDYLFAHIKRRHDVKQTPSLTYQEETNKLQLEIKELKERLNSNEKYVQNHLGNAIRDKVKNDDGMSKVSELEMKFDNFKALVETELKLFETHKNFQEKYEKLIELSLKNIKSDKNVGDYYIYEPKEKNVGDFSINEPKEEKQNVEQKTSSTQTEENSTTVLFSNNNVADVFKSSKSEIYSCNELDEKVATQAYLKLEKVESAIEETLQGSLEKIDNHIESFLDKLHEIQEVKITSALEIISKMEDEAPPTKASSVRDTKSSPDLFVNNLSSSENGVKSKKVRKKLEVASDSVISKPGSKCAKDLHKKLETIKQIRKSNEIQEKPKEMAKEPDLQLRTSNVELSLRTPLAKPDLVLPKLSSKQMLRVNAQEEVIRKLNNCLMEIGISPNWTRLPERTFIQALDAVRYQASIAKRSIPTYTKMRQKLANQVKKEAQPRVKKVQSVSTEIMLRNIKTPVGGRGENNRSKSVDDCDIISEKFHQRNVMYSSDTDSEIDFIFRGKEGYTPAGTFSAVVQELKGINSKKNNVEAIDESKEFQNGQPLKPKAADKVKTPEPSGTSSEELELDDPKYELKSALKHHPLPEVVTKKVLFDLEKSDDCKGENKTVVDTSDDGSSSSLNGSFLDGSNNFDRKKSGKGQKSSDISDWDLSD